MFTERIAFLLCNSKLCFLIFSKKILGVDIFSTNNQVRPWVRQNFPNFLFSRVSEMFSFQSLEFFLEKTGIFELAKFSQKSWKEVWKFKFGKSFDINQNCMSVLKISKKLVKIWNLMKKNPVFEFWDFGSKSLEIVWKKFRKVWKLFNSKLSENYKKMTFNTNFENWEKLVLTQKSTQKFG